MASYKLINSQRISKSLLVPSRLGLLMLLVFLLEISFNFRLNFLGILPLSIPHIFGVLFAPLIHGGFLHLISNLVPFFILSFLLYYFYDRVADHVLLNVYLVTNLVVWMAGRPYFHIGSSGLVYGLLFFLISMGLFRATFQSVLVAVAIFIIYGSIIYGILPSNGRISWESHLAGACVGVVSAFYNSRKVRLSSF